MSVLPLSQRRSTSTTGQSPPSPLPRQPVRVPAPADRIVTMKKLYQELASAHESEKHLLQRVEASLNHPSPSLGQSALTVSSAALFQSPQPSSSVDAKLVWGERRDSENRSVGSSAPVSVHSSDRVGNMSVWSHQRCGVSATPPLRSTSKESVEEKSVDDVAIVGMSSSSHSSTDVKEEKTMHEHSRKELEDKVRSLEQLTHVLMSQQEALHDEIKTLREEVSHQRKVNSRNTTKKAASMRTPHRKDSNGYGDDVLLHESTQKLLREAERQLQFEDVSMMDTTRGTIDGETPPRSFQ